MKRMAFSALIGVLLLAALSINAQSEPLPVFVAGDCPVAFAAGTPVECGEVIVPVNRQEPDSGSVRLAVAVFPARSDTPAPDPVLYLDGGPGERTLDAFANGLNSLLDALNQQRDVIVFDYRGMGYSSPALTCPEADGTTSVSWVAECRQRWADEGVDVANFTTRDNAADGADVVRALGYESYNIWGGSYGSSVALTLLRDQPEHVRAALITALQPPQGDLESATPVYNLRALAGISALCEADAACSAAFPFDLVEAAAVIVERLDATPFVVETPEGAVELTGFDIIAVLAEFLKDEANIPLVPGLIAALFAEQYDFVLPYADVSFFAPDSLRPLGAWLSMRCTDSILVPDPEAYDAALADMPAAFRASLRDYHQQQVAMCETWGARIPVDADRQPARTDTPVLIISGALDPYSSQEWLDSALETLPNGYGYMLPYHMHFVIHNPCAAQMITGFIDDPTIEPDASCMAEIAPPGFQIPSS